MPPRANDVPRASDDQGRDESEAERNDRNLADLLQELRVAGLGVQVLFGFLLSLPFTVRFVKLSTAQRGLYVASLLFAALSTLLLCAPVAYHRFVFRRHEKARLLRAANGLVICGLATVSVAISSAVLLVVSFVEQGSAAIAIGGTTFASFVTLWFGFPLTRRWKGGRLSPSPAAHPPPSNGQESR